MKLRDLPRVHPMMVREFDPGKDVWGCFRDKVFLFQMDGTDLDCRVTDIGMAESRLCFDADVVDQSGAVLEFTTDLMMRKLDGANAVFAFFTSRRWRTHRPEDGGPFTWPMDGPLQFIGNPYFIEVADGQIIVHREPSYLIKSGCQLQAEQDQS